MADETLVSVKDLVEKSDEELRAIADSTRSVLFKSRFENYANRLNDTSRIGKLRRQLARIQTIQTARKDAGGKKSEG